MQNVKQSDLSFCRSSGKLLVISPMVFITCLKVSSESAYVLDVKAVSWTGTGYDAANTCCDGYVWAGWSLQCDTSCENKFKFCLRPYGYQTSSEQCPLGSYQTGNLGSNSITFGDPIDTNIPNPMSFNGTAGWTVSTLHAGLNKDSINGPFIIISRALFN